MIPTKFIITTHTEEGSVTNKYKIRRVLNNTSFLLYDSHLNNGMGGTFPYAVDTETSGNNDITILDKYDRIVDEWKNVSRYIQPESNLSAGSETNNSETTVSGSTE